MSKKKKVRKKLVTAGDNELISNKEHYATLANLKREILECQLRATTIVNEGFFFGL